MESIEFILRVALAAVFALAALAKVRDLAGTRKALQEFGVPSSAVPLTAFALPTIEFLIAVGLLFAPTANIAAISAAAIMGLFTAAIAYQLAAGRSPSCRCFGEATAEPIGKGTIARNVILLAAASVLAFLTPTRPLAETNEALVLLLTTFAALVAAISVFLKLETVTKNQATILRRLEAVELLGGSPVERDEAGHPSDRLPMGAPFPDFELPSAAGRTVAFDQLLDGRSAMLFLFVSPECEPCRGLAEEIREWTAEFDGRLRFVLVSRRSASENRSKFGAELETNILLQTDRELGRLVYAKWTPTAILVDREGDIASHPAVGDAAIRELVERIRKAGETLAKTYFANGASRPHKIGKPVPHFHLNDLEANAASDEIFVTGEMLAVFLSLNCEYCKDLIERIRGIEVEGRDSLVILSDGPADDLRELGLRSPILLDPKFKVAAEFGMSGTPSAVLVRDGKIATETAEGGPNILALIGRYDSN